METSNNVKLVHLTIEHMRQYETRCSRSMYLCINLPWHETGKIHRAYRAWGNGLACHLCCGMLNSRLPSQAHQNMHNAHAGSV